jgi:colanic acid biosynthesis glycosyl transferase WcaI
MASHISLLRSGFTELGFLEVSESSNRSREIRSITIWGINYAPEKTGIGPQTTWLAEALVKKGYEVRVVCAFTYYPAWMKDPKDQGKLYRSERINGVTVQRNWLYVPKSPSLAKRTLQQLSFVTFAALRLLISRAADQYIIVSPPFLMSPVMRILAYLKSRPYVVHLQDDEVQAAYETTNMGFRAYSFLKTLEVGGYRGAKRLSTISEGMRTRLSEHLHAGNPESDDSKNHPVVLLSNRVMDDSEESQPGVARFREKLKTKRLLVYSGNLGDKQVLDAFIPAVAQFNRDDLIFYICGQGAQKEHLQQLIDATGADNIIFESLLPEDEYRTLLAAADACVLSEMTHKGDWLSPGICFASKMLSYMKQKKPLLLYAGPGSEAAGIVEKENCGFSLKPDERIDDLLIRFQSADEESLRMMGNQAREFYDRFVETNNLSQWCEKVFGNEQPLTRN